MSVVGQVVLLADPDGTLRRWRVVAAQDADGRLVLELAPA